jgi:electron transport complex protein RnfE|tara:strand:+ start:29798 stop:30460 length:663 start_codon:yes stop_codon:yes gene_type:complete
MSTDDRTMDDFLKGLWDENPVFVHLLGMCPVLAVSNTVVNALSMGLATLFVLILSSALISLLRSIIPKQVRIAAYILIIATFVTVAEYVIQAVSLEIHRGLGAFISLIVVNCMILGQAESFASKNNVVTSVIAAAGTGVGFIFAIFCMGAVREVIGSGTFAGIDLFGPNYQPWVIMILPGGGFFVLGALLLVTNRVNIWLVRRREALAVSVDVSSATQGQ